MKALITGGSGCGKSAYGEELALRLSHGKRYYIATMRILDEESLQKAERHRLRREGMGFETLERLKGLQSLPLERDSTLLLECLPNWLANEMFDGGEPEAILPALKALARVCRHTIVVTNDIFLDGACYPASTQRYMETLAWLNREWAALADVAVEVVYSIPVALKGVLP